jgi:hypothetical protein
MLRRAVPTVSAEFWRKIESMIDGYMRGVVTAAAWYGFEIVLGDSAASPVRQPYLHRLVTQLFLASDTDLC